MNILLCNDDGIFAPGLLAMRRELLHRGHAVCVVAPDSERSASGHAITLRRPLHVKAYDFGDEHAAYATDGTPADCVRLGVMELFPQADMVVSGINPGANTGKDTLYSGTVSAALEGAMQGLQALAVSIAWVENPDYTYAARLGADMAGHLFVEPMDKGMMCNLNVPSVPQDGVRGVRIAPLNDGTFASGYELVRSPMSGSWYFTKNYQISSIAMGSERDLIEKGYATVTYLSWRLETKPPARALPDLPHWRPGE